MRELYQRGSVLFRQGSSADHVWLVLKGWVHVVRADAADQNTHAVVLFTVTPRELMCGVSAFELGDYTASGIAGTFVETLRILAEPFVEALKQEPQFAYAVLCACTRRLRQMAEQYGAMGEPVSHRIIRALLRLQGQFGDRLPVTHRELAQMAWTTTESAIRTMGRLKQDGHVGGSRGMMVLKHPQALGQMLRTTNGHPRIS